MILDVPAGAPEREFSLAIRRIFSSRDITAEDQHSPGNHTLTSQRHGGGYIYIYMYMKSVIPYVLRCFVSSAY